MADCFRVRLADVPLSSHEGMFDDVDGRWHAQARQALARSQARQAPHLDFFVEASGPAGMSTVLKPRGHNAPPDDFIYLWARLWLTAEERDQLRADFDAMCAKYAAISDQALKPHATLLHVVLVPESSR